MINIKKFVRNNTFRDLYKHYEDMLMRRETRIKEVGIYPKNQEKMLEYFNDSDNFIDKSFMNVLFFKRPEDYRLLCMFCNESDVLFLKNNLDVNKRNMLFINIVNLSSDFIEKRIKHIQLNWRDMRHRTYESMYKIFQVKYPVNASYIRYTKPKNPREKYFYEELSKNHKFSKKMFILDKKQVEIIYNYYRFQQL